MTARTITNSRLVDGLKIDNLPSDTQAELATKVPEAPIDGNVYARKDGGWVEASAVAGVSSVNGQTGDVTLTASDVGAPSGSGTSTGINTGDQDLTPFVAGPASATDNTLTRFDGTTGKLVQNSSVSLSDNGDFADANALTFDTTPTAVPTSTGTLRWNPDEDTLDIVQSSSILQVGQELQWNVRNNTASTITEGTPVYVTGTL